MMAVIFGMSAAKATPAVENVALFSRNAPAAAPQLINQNKVLKVCAFSTESAFKA